VKISKRVTDTDIGFRIMIIDFFVGRTAIVFRIFVAENRSAVGRENSRFWSVEVGG